MTTLMTFITCLAALVFLAIVAFALTRIVAALESIGGKGDSYLGVKLHICQQLLQA